MSRLLQLAVDLVLRHPPRKECLNVACAKRVARHCVGVAQSYGMDTTRDVLCFVLHMLTIGPEFHCEPSIRTMLANRGIPNDEKMERLLHSVFDESWRRAAQRSSEHYWAQVVDSDGA